MQSSLFGWATVLLVFFDITMQSSLLGWGTVQSCLFRYNNAEFYVGMGNGSVLSFLMQQCRVRCWDGERFSLVFFDITMQNSLLARLQHCRGFGGGALAVLQGGLGDGTRPNSKVKKVLVVPKYDHMLHMDRR